MKIENIIISDINDTNAKLTFTISECEENVNIYLKINEDDYINIYTNKINEELTYELTNLRRGLNTLFLKLISSTEEYISDVIEIVIKDDASISSINCLYTDSTGKYIFDFTLNGDEYLNYSIELKIDDEEYIQILDNQIIGDKTYEGNNLSLGEHICKIKVNDGYDEYESEEYVFTVENHKPVLSELTIVDIKNNSCMVCYGVNDVETRELTHSIIINGSKNVILPIKTSDFYSHTVTDLEVGKYLITIGISDGVDEILTSTIEIEIFEDSTSNKRQLEIAKTRYDFAYNQLKRIVESTISDDVFDYNIENDVISKCQNYYQETYAEFNRISMISIDSIGNKKVSNAKTELNKEINDVYGAIDTLEDTMETTFKDGILSDTEKETLKSTLNLVAKEKVDVDSDYLRLYNNIDLIDIEKIKLKSAYDNFIEKHNTLVLTVNSIINKTGIIDNMDKSNLDNAFEDWRTAVGNYRDASMVAIDSIARKQIDNSAESTNKYWSDIILGEDGIQERIGSLETKITGDGGIEERLQSAEQIITKDGITNLVKDEFYTKEVVDNKIEEKVDDAIGENVGDVVKDLIENDLEEIVNGSLKDIIDEEIEGLQNQINSNVTEIEKAKDSIAEHTTSLNDITSRVSTTENNVTKINGEIVKVEERVSTAEQKITEEAITNTMSKTFYTKDEADEKMETQTSNVEQTINSWSVRISENEEDIASLKISNEEFNVTIGNKADSSNIISMINASTEQITISSSKINITGLVTFDDLSTSGKTVVNGDNIKTGTIDASLATIKNINADNITSGSLSADRISGGTLKGTNILTSTLGDYTGVSITSDSFKVGCAGFFFESARFTMQCKKNIAISSMGDITITPGLAMDGTSTGGGIVNIPDCTLKTQKIMIINDATIQGACAISGSVSCANLSSVGAISASNGFSSNNGGVFVTGSFTTSGGNVNATNGQVQSKTLYVTKNSILSGNVECGSNLTVNAGTITANNLKSNNNMNCVNAGISGDMSVDNNAYIKYLYVNGSWVSSDKRLKTDIKYVDVDNQSIGESGWMSPNVNITKKDMLDFIEVLPIASYRYTQEVNDGRDATHYGLIVQDVLYTKVGSELVATLGDDYKTSENPLMGYSPEKLTVFMCGALQEEIRLRKELEERIKFLEDKSNK